MLEKPVDTLAWGDIQALIDQGVEEARTLDYKEAIPNSTSSSSHEFLADVSSFANADGGDLVFGVAAERDVSGQPTGRPREIVGLDGDFNADKEILTLENRLRNGIAPRIAGIEFRVINHQKPVLIVRIPRSWNAPHMVTLGGASKFYSRGSRGRVQLDVLEIGLAFEEARVARHRLTDIRTERIDLVQTKRSALQVPDGPKIVLHAVPLSSRMRRAKADALPLSKMARHLTLLYGGHNLRPNFDGVLLFDGTRGIELSYTQLFRDGTVEWLDARIVRGDYVPFPVLQKQTLNAIAAYQTLARSYALGSFAVLLTLLNVKDFVLMTSDPRGAGRIDRDHLIFPEILVDEAGDPKIFMTPLFDALWQSAGYDKCYDCEP